jgi:hypothetical protein
VFAAIPEVSDLHAQGATIRMRVGNGIDRVIKVAAGYTVVDLRVEHPSLDEVFIGYYDEQQA